MRRTSPLQHSEAHERKILGVTLFTICCQMASKINAFPFSFSPSHPVAIQIIVLRSQELTFACQVRIELLICDKFVLIQHKRTEDGFFALIIYQFDLFSL